MNPEQKRTAEVIKKIQKFLGDKKEQVRSWWQGEEFIDKLAGSIQNRVEKSGGDLEKCQKEFTEAINIYGEVVLSGKDFSQDYKSRLKLYGYYKTIRDQAPDHNRQEMNIESENNPNFEKEVKEYIERKVEETTITFLFANARETAAKPFDMDKEHRQIRAVFHMLSGDWVAMDTGDGKTSAVIPIYSIIKSIFHDPERPLPPALITSSAEGKLTDELENKVKSMIRKITSTPIANQDAKKLVTNKLAVLQKPAPNYEVEDNKNQSEIEKLFSSPPEDIYWMAGNGANIGFLSHEKVIFGTAPAYITALESALSQSGERKEIIKRINEITKNSMPFFCIDEVHLPPQNPFIVEFGREKSRSKQIVNFKYETVKRTLSDYLMIRLISDSILSTEENRAKYIVIEGKQAQLSDFGRQHVSGLRKQLIQEINYYLDKSRHDQNIAEQIINKFKIIITEEIEPNFDFEGEFSEDRLLEFVRDFWQDDSRYLPLMEGEDNDGPHTHTDQNFQMMIDGYLKTIGSLEKGSDYITPETVRDHLRGITLAKHQFDEETLFYLNVAEHKPYLQSRKNIDLQINFYTWLTMIAQGNVVGLSNDLFYTDPLSGKRELSPLGEMVQKYTDGRVIDLAPKKVVSERIPIPDPIIGENDVNLIDKIVDSTIKKKKPELIVCWNDDFGKELFRRLEKTGRRVRIIDSETSDEAADSYQEQFSNYGIDVLISTGRKSFATDFRDKQGKFTDFEVAAVNPETVFQISQAYGRRRLPKRVEDFSLYFDKHSLKMSASILYQDRYPSFFDWVKFLRNDDPTYPDLIKLLDEPGNLLDSKEQNKLKNIIITVMGKNQKRLVGNWQDTIDQEVLFIQQIAPNIKRAKKDFIESNWRKASSPINRVIEEEIAKVLQGTAFEETMTIDVRKRIEELIRNQAIKYFSSLSEDVLNDYLMDINLSHQQQSLVANEVQREKFLIDKMTERINNQYQEQWNQELSEIDDIYLNRTLREQIKEKAHLYIDIFRSMDVELKRQGFSLSQIEQMYYLTSPKYEQKNNPIGILPHATIDETHIDACHEQTIKVLGSGKNKTVYIRNSVGDWILADRELFEIRLISLNDIVTLPKKNQEAIDVYFPGKTSKFLRVLVKR